LKQFCNLEQENGKLVERVELHEEQPQMTDSAKSLESSDAQGIKNEVFELERRLAELKTRELHETRLRSENSQSAHDPHAHYSSSDIRYVFYNSSI